MLPRLARSMKLLVPVILAAASGCQDSSAGGPTQVSLTAEQQEVITAVVQQVEAAAAAMATFSGVVDAHAIAVGGVSADADACPAITAELQASVIEMSIDFGEACTNGWLGGRSASGAITATFNIAARVITLEFDNVSIDDRGVDGRAALERRDDLTTGATSLEGTIDITTAQVGSVEGDATISFDRDTGVITVSYATLTLTGADGTEYTVTLEDIVVDPVENGNFVPEAGTAEIAMSPRIVITFDDESPVDGTVDVTVGIVPAGEYKVPGIPAI